MSADIRVLECNDIITVAKLAKEVSAYPWSEAVFADCMKADYHAWVLGDNAIAKGKVLGFIVVLSQMEECHLLNIAVSLNFQRQGYGRQLLQHVIEHAQSKGLHRILLETRESNASAIFLFQTLGFVTVGGRKNYYPGPSKREDALIMALTFI